MEYVQHTHQGPKQGTICHPLLSTEVYSRRRLTSGDQTLEKVQCTSTRVVVPVHVYQEGGGVLIYRCFPNLL